NGIRLWEIVQRLNAEENLPDILIAQTWGSLIDGAVLSKIRDAFGTVIINIAMDDRHQYWGVKINSTWSGTSALIPDIDLSLTAAPECTAWYLKESCPALFFPEASDPDIFHPMPELPKTHDVCFVGACYGIRKKIAKAIEASGVKVAAYGNKWANGRIAIEEVPELFAQSRIILGIGTIGHCTDFYSLKMRDFDVPMSGSLYLTHHNPDLENLFVIGKEIETYRTPKECVEKVVYYLSHPDEAEAIASAGRLRAEKEHTWGKRFSVLFEYLGMSI
ncbi:MAG: glycosyltransferase, partial [Deltaproteobacteria bacterium]|nr:glycosyltransferase [Deltaproteobacteria bacterium]